MKYIKNELQNSVDYQHEKYMHAIQKKHYKGCKEVHKHQQQAFSQNISLEKRGSKERKKNNYIIITI